MKVSRRLALSLFLFALVFGACSGGSSAADGETGTEGAAGAEATDPASAGSPGASPDADAAPTPTTTAEPTATPVPTPTPIPDPIFERVILPEAASAGTQRSVFAAATPQGDFDWLGVGNELNHATGDTLPLTWEFTIAPELFHTLLPLPDGVTNGSALHAAVVMGEQFVAGNVTIDDELQAAMWRRTSDGPWRLFLNPLPADIAPDDATWLSRLVSSDTWAMTRLGIESGNEFDDEGDAVVTSVLYRQGAGGDWEEFTLPGVSSPGWFFGQYLDGDQGLVVARRDDPQNPASMIFVSTDAGVTWEAAEVELTNGRELDVSAALWDRGEWVLIGGIGVEGERSPAKVVRTSDGGWQTQVIELTLGDEEPPGDTYLRTIGRLDDQTLLATVSTTTGRHMVTSTDGGATWLVADDKWNGATAGLRSLVRDPRRERFFAVRGWDKPVWLSQDGVTEIAIKSAPAPIRNIETLLVHNNEFVFTSVKESEGFEDNPVTQIWSSGDLLDWSRVDIDTNHESRSLSSVGDGLVSYGTDNQGYVGIRVYGSDSLAPGLAETFGRQADTPISFEGSVQIGESTGRSLFASVVVEDDIGVATFSFVTLGSAAGSPEAPSAFEVPSAGDARPHRVCPQVDSGEMSVLLAESDGMGSLIEVWVDAEEPRVGGGARSDGGGFAGALFSDCSRFGSGLILTGTSCSATAVAASSFSRDECSADIWTSTYGLEWADHPQRSVLADAELAFTHAVGSSGDVAIVAGTSKDGFDPGSLWLVTPDEILAVPLRSGPLEDFNFRHVAVTEDQVIVASQRALYVADLDYLIERARTEAGVAVDGLSDDSSGSATATPTVAPAVPSDEDQSASVPAPIPISPVDAGSSATPTAVPAPPAAPAPTQPPAAPAPTALPAPTPAPSPTAPAGSGGGSGAADGSVTITATVVCTTTRDPATGADTEVCEVVRD